MSGQANTDEAVTQYGGGLHKNEKLGDGRRQVKRARNRWRATAGSGEKSRTICQAVPSTVVVLSMATARGKSTLDAVRENSWKQSEKMTRLERSLSAVNQFISNAYTLNKQFQAYTENDNKQKAVNHAGSKGEL